MTIAGPPPSSFCVVPTAYSGAVSVLKNVPAFCVLPSIAREDPPGPSDNTVPENVTADPPGNNVREPIIYESAAVEALGIPMTKAVLVGSRDTTVSDWFSCPRAVSFGSPCPTLDCVGSTIDFEFPSICEASDTAGGPEATGDVGGVIVSLESVGTVSDAWERVVDGSVDNSVDNDRLSMGGKDVGVPAGIVCVGVGAAVK